MNAPIHILTKLHMSADRQSRAEDWDAAVTEATKGGHSGYSFSQMTYLRKKKNPEFKSGDASSVCVCVCRSNLHLLV